MIKSKIDLPKKETLEIDLTGPDGNSFHLLAVARKLSKQFGLDFSGIQKKMTESNYENLIQVFDTYFGEHVILYR
jgi:hypothetical protein